VARKESTEPNGRQQGARDRRYWQIFGSVELNIAAAFATAGRATARALSTAPLAGVEVVPAAALAAVAAAANVVPNDLAKAFSWVAVLLAANCAAVN
jgi:hypothetical protein